MSVSLSNKYSKERCNNEPGKLGELLLVECVQTISSKRK